MALAIIDQADKTGIARIVSLRRGSMKAMFVAAHEEKGWLEMLLGSAGMLQV